jgi:hypothetical protein
MAGTQENPVTAYKCFPPGFIGTDLRHISRHYRRYQAPAMKHDMPQMFAFQPTNRRYPV